MKALLKWPGGKEKELPVIRKNMPDYSGRYIEPFVGGGTVFFDVAGHDCYINDKSSELINLYRCVQQHDEDFVKYIQEAYNEFMSISTFVDSNSADVLNLYHEKITVEAFLKKHDKIFKSMLDGYQDLFQKELKRNLTSKIKRSKKLEKEQGPIPNTDRQANIEAALKSSYYMVIRYMLNHASTLSNGRAAAIFLFVREYCYSSMFRYNAKGEFNVPYGGISYNRKDFKKKIDYILSPEMKTKLETATIVEDDFEEFMKAITPTEDDFIFLDPPYDSEFSTYAQNEFGKAEQIRLHDYLISTPAKIMLVIKNTNFIYDLYKDDFHIFSFSKNYLVSFKNRNDRHVEHLLITNYELPNEPKK